MACFFLVLFSGCNTSLLSEAQSDDVSSSRQRILLDDDWQFMKYKSAEAADDLIYDVRPEVTDERDDKPADSKPTEAVTVESDHRVLKPWILPTGNPFLKDSTKH